MRHSTNPWVILVLVCIAQFMVILDATVVNVALPSIQKDLGLSEANLQWIVNAYALVFGGFLLLGGRAGDLLGRKRLFLAGVVVFTVASLLNGLATSSTWLIGTRALQGLGAAFISPAALAIISTTFSEGKERGKALGVWAAIASGGSAVGLVLGGVLTQAFSWPWIFFINVPIGIAAFVLSLRLIPESIDEHAERSFDVAGAVTATGGLMTLVYAIVKAQSDGWTSALTLSTFAAAAILLTAFVLIEQRASAPLVRLNIFRVRSLTAANVVMFLVASGLFAMFFFNSLYLQKVLDYGPLKAGLAFLPFTAGIMVSAGLASQFAPRIGVRPVAVVGMLVTALGLAWLARVPVHGSYLTDVMPSILLTSLGHGRGVRAAHARRDDGARGLGPGPRVGPLQHVPADRRRARARDPEHDRGKPVHRCREGVARSRLPLGVRRRCLLHHRRSGRARRAPAPQRRGADPGRRRCSGRRSDQRMTLRADAQRNLDRLLDVAGACFAEQGLDVSIDEIARRAGVGHGTVFRNFPTKDALVEAVLNERMHELAAAAHAALDEPDAWDGFAGFFRYVAALYADNLALVEGLERCAGSPEKADLSAAVEQLVKRAQRAGVLRRDVSAEDVMMLVPTAARYPEIVLDGLRVT